MKKILLGLVSSLIVTSSFAQLYVRASVGYNLPAATEQIGSDYQTNYDQGEGNYYYTEKGVYGSFGSGVSLHLGVGGVFKNGVLGYDVEFGYVKGKSYTLRSSDNYYSQSSYSNTDSEATSIQIAPAITFTTPTGAFRPFARLGPTFAISKLTSESEMYEYYYTGRTDKVTNEFTGGVNIGLKGVAGVGYNIGENLQVYVEVDFVALAYTPKKREITKYERDGQDILPTIHEKLREIEYEDEVTRTSQEPMPEVRPSFPMSSFGFQAGVKFIF